MNFHIEDHLPSSDNPPGYTGPFQDSPFAEIQGIASLFATPPPPSLNTPAPDSLPPIDDDISFLSQLPFFPILRPSRRPNPVNDDPPAYQDMDFELSDEQGSLPPDEHKPIEAAVEPFHCRFFGRYAHESDCRRYYVCYGPGTSHTERTCRDGQAFHPRHLRCGEDWSACKFIPFCKENYQVLPDFHHKQHYYVCVRRNYYIFGEDFNVYRRTCQSGMIFNIQKKSCVHFKEDCEKDKGTGCNFF